MFKDVLRTLDVGILPQIGLIAFVIAFAAILVYTFTLSRGDVASFSDLPFDDALPASPADASDDRPRDAPAGA